MSDDQGRELEWNDTVEEGDNDFTPLPAGECEFEVVGFKRARHKGSANLTPCNKAIVSIKLTKDGRSSTIDHNFFLHTKCENFICLFFKSIGMRKSGEKFAMDWTSITGKTGTCKIKIKKWIAKSGERAGEEMSGNDIVKFNEPSVKQEEKANVPATSEEIDDECDF